MQTAGAGAAASVDLACAVTRALIFNGAVRQRRGRVPPRLLMQQFCRNVHQKLLPLLLVQLAKCLPSPLQAPTSPVDLAHVDQLIQYGAGSDGTTFQTMTLSAFACATANGAPPAVKKHQDLSAAIRLYWGGRHARRERPIFVTSISGFVPHADYWSHSVAHPPWRDEAEQLEAKWELPKGSIRYVQHVSELASRDWRVVEDYAEVFNSSEAVRGAVVEFIRLWSILRRCCGPQMSRSYAVRLYEKAHPQNHTSWTGTPTSQHSLAWDACETVNVDVVEKMIMQTVLFKRCPQLRQVQSGLNFFRLTGSFCKSFHSFPMHVDLASFRDGKKTLSQWKAGYDWEAIPRT